MCAASRAHAAPAIHSSHPAATLLSVRKESQMELVMFAISATLMMLAYEICAYFLSRNSH